MPLAAMLTTVLFLAFAAAAVAFVAWPLLASGRSVVPGEPEEGSPAERQKLEAYAALKEAEFDYRMGKLSEADYAALRARYRRQALDALASLGAAQQARPSHGARRRLAPGPGRRARFCPQCGRRTERGAKFCANCGTRLPAGTGDGQRATPREPRQRTPAGAKADSPDRSG